MKNSPPILVTHTPHGVQRGLVVIELAITLPLVLLIMLATAEFGRAFYQYTTLSKAVETGTRYYASTALDNTIPVATKVSTIENLVVFGSPAAGGTSILPGFNNSNVTEISSVGPVGTVPADHVRVTADYTFVPIIGRLPIFGTVSNFTMTASQTMRVL